MTITQLPTNTIISRTRIGTYGFENYQLMADFKKDLNQHDLINETTVIYALAYDNPLVIPPEKCRYKVAASVSQAVTITGSTDTCEQLPMGDYYVCVVAHTSEAIGQLMGSMLTILSSAGHEFDGSRPIVERYRPELLKQDLCEVCLPIS